MHYKRKKPGDEDFSFAFQKDESIAAAYILLLFHVYDEL